MGPNASKGLRSSPVLFRPLRGWVNVSSIIGGGFALALQGKLNAIKRHISPKRRVGKSISYASYIDTSCATKVRKRRPRQVLDVYAPAQFSALAPVFVFFHGGTWTFFSKEHFTLLGERLAEQGFVVVIPSYTCFPDGMVDDQVAELDGVMKWTAACIDRFGGDPKSVFLSGQSSGAHITSLWTLRKLRARFPNPPNDDDLLPCGTVFMSGAFDPAEQEKWERGRGVADISPLTIACYLDIQGPHDSVNSTALAREFGTYFPPSLILTGSNDSVVSPRMSEEFFLALRKKSNFSSNFHVMEGDDHSAYLVDMMVSETPSKWLRQIIRFCKHIKLPKTAKRPHDLRSRY